MNLHPMSFRPLAPHSAVSKHGLGSGAGTVATTFVLGYGLAVGFTLAKSCDGSRPSCEMFVVSLELNILMGCRSGLQLHQILDS